jgi:hypothetical protein
MSRRLEIINIALVAMGTFAVGAGTALYFAYPVQVSLLAGAARSYLPKDPFFVHAHTPKE